jgi:hypothetical protein
VSVITRAGLRELGARKVGGWWSGTVDLPPTTTDADAMRVVLSSDLARLERPPSDLSMASLWVGRHNQSRSIRSDSFRNLSTLLFTPGGGDPSFTFWGYGNVGPVDLTGTDPTADAETLRGAISGLPGLESVTVSAAGPSFRIEMPSEEYNAQVDHGTLTNGFGRLEATSAWRTALTVGTAWELSERLPFDDDGTNSGWNYLVNRALAYTPSIAQLPYTTVETDPALARVIRINEPWLRYKNQIHAIWRPFRRILRATFSPPVAGSYDLTLQMGTASPLVVSGLAHDASNETIASALASDAGRAGLPTGAGCTGAATRTIMLTDVYYNDATIAASAGTLSSQSLSRPRTAHRYDYFAFVPNRNVRQIELGGHLQAGESILIEASCTADLWTCPQVDYQTLGTDLVDAGGAGPRYDLDQADCDEELASEILASLACLELAKRDPDQKKHWLDRPSVHANVAADLKMDADRPTEANARSGHRGDVRGFWKVRGGGIRG